MCVCARARTRVHSLTSQKLQHDCKNDIKVGGLKVLLMNERHTLQLLKTSDGSSLRYRAKPNRTAVLAAWTSLSCWVLWHGELCKVLQLHEQHSWSKLCFSPGTVNSSIVLLNNPVTTTVTGALHHEGCPLQHLNISLALLNTTAVFFRQVWQQPSFPPWYMTCITAHH